MPIVNSLTLSTKIFYRPIDAAIRWCERMIYEREILVGFGDDATRSQLLFQGETKVKRQIEATGELKVLIGRIFNRVNCGPTPK